MTLLTICRDAADETGITRPTAVVGNSAPEVQKLLRYANKVGRRIMKVAEWQVLRKEQTFTALATEAQTGIIPADFDRFVPETFWDRTNRNLISGPITAVEWQGFKAQSYSDTSRPKFILRQDSVSVLPNLTAGSALAFEYISKNWCQSSLAVAQAAWAADADTAIVDEELLTLGLIYEFLEGEGQPSQSAAYAYEARFDLLLQNDQNNPAILSAGDVFGGGRHFAGAPSVTNLNIF